MLRFLASLFGLFLLSPSLSSAATWLLIPTDVRSRALGNTGTALPDLDFALDANPALLTQTLTGVGGLSTGKIQDFPDAKVSLFSAYGTAGSHLILDRVAVGLAYRQQKATLLERTFADPYGGSSGGVIELYNRGYMLGVGIVISEHASAGITLKHTTYSSSGGFIGVPGEWDWDLGIYVGNLLGGATFGDPQDGEQGDDVISPPKRNRARGVSLGVAVQDFGHRASESGEPVKVAYVAEVVTIGASYRPLLTRPCALLVVGELAMRDPLNMDPLDPRPGDEILRWGVECSAHRLLDFRLGMETDPATGDYYMTSGIGAESERFRIDYSIYWHTGLDGLKQPRLGFSVRFQ